MRFPHRFPALILILLAMLVGCATTPNYLDPTGPRYAGAWATPPQRSGQQVLVVTWNIQYSRDIDRAIVTFQQDDALKHADVILLQEMDVEGVEAIARAMGWNYVYYPASIHVKHGQDFGEAILSPWPLTDDAKIILPHYSPRNGQIRMAVRAWVQMPTPLLVYSVHTETSLMTPRQRLDQVHALLDDVPQHAKWVIIGGDFNTITSWEQETLVQTMEEAGFVWTTGDAGSTLAHLPAKITMDYIFARGLQGVETGVVQTEVSDHLPLWVTLQPDS